MPEIHTSFIPSSDKKLGYRNDELEQTLTKQGYADLVNANPWKELDYKQSGWQKFLGALGFRTGYDVAKENQQFQYNEYLSNIQSMAFQNQYDTPEAQAERMRQAGMNPDLQGTGDVAGSAGLPEDTNNTLPNNTDMETLQQGANFIMSGLSMAIGFGKDIGALKQISIANEAGQLGNTETIMSMAINAVLNHSPKEMTIDHTPKMEEGDDLTPSIKRDNPEWIADYKSGLSKKQYRQFSKLVSDFWNDSARTDVERYKDWRSRMEERQKAFVQYGNPNYSDEDDVLLAVSDVFSKYVGRIEKKRARNTEQGLDLESQEMSKESEYQSAIDPTLRAEAENATNANTKQSQEMEEDLNSMMAEIMSMLHDKADKGSKFASIALICFSLMKMISMPKMSFGIGGGGSTNHDMPFSTNNGGWTSSNTF